MVERILDRRVESDPIALARYPIRTLVEDVAPRSYTWDCPMYLDQGQEGACVEYGWAHELASRPVQVNITGWDHHARYKKIQTYDQWEGEDYEGTSVIAGARFYKEQGKIPEYRWAKDLNDLILAVGHYGPAVMGLDWYTGMMEPDENGYIHPTGIVEGGHCIVNIGVNYKRKRFELHQSWGRSWGRGGRCYISFDDTALLLANGGEGCIPVVRKM